MKVVFILMDSLNRHFLKAYNEKAQTLTPNIDSFAKDSIKFCNHWLGSAPCMPARRDLFTGRLNFLERYWGPIEPFDVTLPMVLRKNNIYTHISTDHTHYFEIGGENYCQQFDTWDVIRGQEFDCWVSRVEKPQLPSKYYGKVSAQYELNKTRYVSDCDYPSPKTFKSACDWINDNKGADNFLLWVEAFDPHEPFDCPDEFLRLYEDNYKGPHFNWSTYAPVTEPNEAIEHLRKCYMATLTMNDKWFGKLIECLKQNDMYDDTMIILTTDHGHMLGEHGYTGKNFMHAYNELAHLPLFIHLPGGKRAGENEYNLTQNIDMMPTLLDYYGVEDVPRFMHGKSLMEMLNGDNNPVREAAIYGWFGKTVNITDGHYTYFRGPKDVSNQPCYAYCSIPTTLWSYVGTQHPEKIEMGRFLKHTKYPVYKIPVDDINLEEIQHIMGNKLYNIDDDYEQQNEIRDKRIEDKMINTMIKLMKEFQTPEEQYQRLGLDEYIK